MDSPLADGPTVKTELRLKTPERNPSTKRASSSLEEEPILKRTILEDDAAEQDDDMLVLKEKQQDKDIIYHALLGHDLTEVYPNRRLQLAANREFIGQVLSTYFSEIYTAPRG